ncbi:MAG: 5-(carboxyamino)imidazole ribonucleotide synthase [Lactobacillales bacterium]|jgi:5-(carboxyamino)imidazole ribonucleotide synthase|nr:5-(carboxyamino)imidazole ribonucleotide synthase [Lactobacillales bacterium]
MAELFNQYRIGIIGGGQLGRMMVLAAKYMGYRATILDPTLDCPAVQVADEHIVGDYDDPKAIKHLTECSDVLTYEFENVDAAVLAPYEDRLPQGTKALIVAQDRINEKNFFEDLNIPIAPWAEIHCGGCLNANLTEIGYPCVLKTARGGYDGKGQVVLKSDEDKAAALELINDYDGTLVLEGWVPFVKEISVVISRNKRGACSIQPVAENIHKNNILHLTIAPARVAQNVQDEAKKLATQIVEGLDYAGTLAIEMFLKEDGSLVINEMAPRPHNSGHFSIEGTQNSQFDTHVRGIMNLAMPEVVANGQSVMLNLLGDELAQAQVRSIDEPTWHVHDYGKAEAKPGRKMGHLTIVTNDVEKTLEKLGEF